MYLLSLCMLGSITSRCSGKEPALLPLTRVDQTRESGGNRAYMQVCQTTPPMYLRKLFRTKAYATTCPLDDPVTWYGINYTGTHVTQWNFQNTGTRISPARLSLVLKGLLCNLRPIIPYGHVTVSFKGPIRNRR